jgi:hypothetical protein
MTAIDRPLHAMVLIANSIFNLTRPLPELKAKFIFMVRLILLKFTPQLPLCHNYLKQASLLSSFVDTYF